MSKLTLDYGAWSQDPTLAKLWEETWRQPHMQIGLQVLISMGLPQKMPLRLAAKVDPIQMQALAGASDRGYFQFLQNIEKLKDATPAAPDAPLSEWEHGAPEEPVL